MKIAEERDDDIRKKERSRGEARDCRRGRDIIEERRAKRELLIYVRYLLMMKLLPLPTLVWNGLIHLYEYYVYSCVTFFTPGVCLFIFFDLFPLLFIFSFLFWMYT